MVMIFRTIIHLFAC